MRKSGACGGKRKLDGSGNGAGNFGTKRQPKKKVTKKKATKKRSK